MTIDVHCRVWSGLDQLGGEISAQLRRRQVEDWGQLDASPAAQERASSSVGASIVLGLRATRLGACVPNEFIADFVAKDPRRRIGVGGIDPTEPGAMDQLEAAVAMGLSGVTVSPPLQGFHPAHSDAMRLYDRCVELGFPVFVSGLSAFAASAQLEFARPALWDEVARSFPRLPIVIGQLGHPWVDETLLLLQKHENVWSDVAEVASRPWQLYGALLNAASLGVMPKLLFGSNFPFQAPTKTIEALYSVNALASGTQLPTIPRSLICGIVERDAMTCLGLDASVERASVIIEPRDAARRPRGPKTSAMLEAAAWANGRAAEPPDE
jgi:hypothetical protein